VKSPQALDALSALAQETRLAIFRLLVRAGTEGKAAGDIAAELDIGATALSFHLKQLSTASLVKSRQAGRFIIYTAEFRTMNALLAYLTENCCAGHACEVTESLATAICPEHSA
jgi:DNA-binding transcriptional ArsR family regulator